MTKQQTKKLVIHFSALTCANDNTFDNPSVMELKWQMENAYHTEICLDDYISS